MSPSKPRFDVSVISTLALKGVLDAAAPGLRVEFHATQALLKDIAAGKSADVVILTDEGSAELSGPLGMNSSAPYESRGCVKIARLSAAEDPVGSDFVAAAPPPWNRRTPARSRRCLITATSSANHATECQW